MNIGGHGRLKICRAALSKPSSPRSMPIHHFFNEARKANGALLGWLRSSVEVTETMKRGALTTVDADRHMGRGHVRSLALPGPITRTLVVLCTEAGSRTLRSKTDRSLIVRGGVFVMNPGIGLQARFLAPPRPN